jgi:hypothetical protein
MDTSTTPVFHRAVLASFGSKSRPGVQYHIHMGADGNVYCDCPSWRFQKNHPMNRSCKHLVAFKQVAVLSGKAVAVQGISPEPVAVRAPRKSRKPRPTFWEKLGQY